MTPKTQREILELLNRETNVSINAAYVGHYPAKMSYAHVDIDLIGIWKYHLWDQGTRYAPMPRGLSTNLEKLAGKNLILLDGTSYRLTIAGIESFGRDLEAESRLAIAEFIDRHVAMQTESRKDRHYKHTVKPTDFYQGDPRPIDSILDCEIHNEEFMQQAELLLARIDVSGVESLFVNTR